MSYHWNSKEIMEDLRGIEDVVRIEGGEAGGDVDTYHIKVHLRDVYDDYLVICGFNTDDDAYNLPPDNVDVEMVELCDSSGDGLQSKNALVGYGYVAVRQYFLDRGAEVVGSMDPYF